MEKVGIFISYNPEDKAIAAALAEALANLSSSLKIFFDHSHADDNYEARIFNSTSKSHWFIMICTGDMTSKDASWLFYEAGQYRARSIEMPSDRVNRIVYLYDDNVPQQIAKYQGVKVSRIGPDGHAINISNEDFWT